MGKVADKYLEVDPWKIIEAGFHPENGRVSESIFSLGNEYMGVRGYFDEGYSGDQLIGSYFNGVWEERPIIHVGKYKGLSYRWAFMVNSVNWLMTGISLDGEKPDLHRSEFSDFKRVLDLKTGILTRSFTWHTRSGKKLQLAFERFISMADYTVGCQKITINPLNFSGSVEIESGVDFATVHEQQENKSYWNLCKTGQIQNFTAALGQTENSGHKVLSAFRLYSSQAINLIREEGPKQVTNRFTLQLSQNQQSEISKIVVN